MSGLSRFRAVGYGAIIGSVFALVAVAILGGRFGLQAAVATPQAEGSPRATIDFVASSGGMYLIIVVAAVLSGLLVGGLINALSRELEPDSPKFPLGWLLPVAGLTSGITGYAVFRGGLGLFSDIDAGVVVISVIWFITTAAVSGFVAGGVTTYIVDRLARPDLLGLGGAAWPTSTGELIGAMARSVGIPLVAVAVAGLFAIGLAQLLLSAEGTLAVILFSLAAAIVLGGAALIAYRPWERNGGATS